MMNFAFFFLLLLHLVLIFEKDLFKYVIQLYELNNYGPNDKPKVKKKTNAAHVPLHTYLYVNQHTKVHIFRYSMVDKIYDDLSNIKNELEFRFFFFFLYLFAATKICTKRKERNGIESGRFLFFFFISFSLLNGHIKSARLDDYLDELDTQKKKKYIFCILFKIHHLVIELCIKVIRLFKKMNHKIE